MPISQEVLARHSEPNVILADGYEYLCDVLQRFIDQDLPEYATFLLARMDDGGWRVLRFDYINNILTRMDEEQQSRILYRPLEDLEWLAPVEQVVEKEGPLTDGDVAEWNRRHENSALVVLADDSFVGLVYSPYNLRSVTAGTLRDLFPRWIGSKSGDPGEESFALPENGEILSPAKGLEEMAEGSGGEETIQRPFFTDIRFAHWLKPGETRPLTVQLTQKAAESSISTTGVNVGFVEEFTPETIHVHLDAPGFVERTNTWQRSIDAYSFQDSDKATFILTAGQDEGARQISIDFRHKERLIGNTRFVVHIAAQEPVAVGPAAADALTFRQPPPDIQIPPSPPPPPDVELRIRADGRRLTFELHSTHQDVDASHAPMGGVDLESDPLAYMEEHYRELNRWAGERPTTQDVITEITDRLTAIGNSLFLALFPEKLKEAYWNLYQLRKEGRIRSLHIVSDEPWIPWEMVKPVNMSRRISDDFLAQGWQISRWLAGPGQVDKLHIQSARLVAPDTDLDFVRRERDFFVGLSGKAVDVGEPLRRLAQVKEITRRGVELLHFSTHGQVDSESIDRSSIALEDNTALRPSDLVGEVIFGLLDRRPLVFMNTCHGARMGFSLAGLGGWASQMIHQARVGVFIGALWEVNDDLAADFALAFYTALQENKTLGESFHSARSAIREKAPANSTWLAYTLYGDPNIRVAWGATGQ